jgi:hypothetical protein
MITNIEDFVKYIPTARGTHFEDIYPFIEEAVIWVEQELFGSELVTSIKAAQAGSDEQKMLDSIIALKAYSTAIPFLDVVQTANGFAVVNNANQAPASKERVERLLIHVEERLYFHIDSLIEYIQKIVTLFEKWRLFPKFNTLTELMYWSGNEFMIYCGEYELFDNRESVIKYEAAKRRIPYLELRRLHGSIKGFQDVEISSYISRDYLNELIEKRRNGTSTDDDKRMLNRLKSVIGLYMRNDDLKAEEQLKAIVNLMVKDVEKYATYASSEEYQLKITERYQNLEEDPTYFFM